MSGGWIKLHRTLIDWEWWDDHNATRLLVYLLCKVNYEDKKWKGIDVPAGSLITSFEKLSEATGLSVKQVRTSMQKLEDSGEVARKAARKGQAVRLIKWDKLQRESEERASNKAEKGQGEGNERATTKEGKKGNNGKEDKKTPPFNFKNSLISLGVEKEVASDFMAVRKAKDGVNTQIAFNAIEREIEKSKLSANDCIKMAVENSWKGFKAQWAENQDNKQTAPETGRKLDWIE